MPEGLDTVFFHDRIVSNSERFHKRKGERVKKERK
jgi:hypothetical protein